MTHSTFQGSMQKIAYKQGFILPVALILLLVSTLLGVTALRVNSLSEKMTVNALQREEAVARAEAALLQAELLVRDNAADISSAIINNPAADNCAAMFDGSAGFCSPATHPQTSGADASNVERWETIFFGATVSPNVRRTPVPVGAPTGTLGTPYIIEFMGHIIGVDADGNNNSKCIGMETDWPYCESDSFQFRITTMAMGDEANSGLVMLQSLYVASP